MNSTSAEIIHIGVNRWDSMIQREQHLILGLSRSHRILFVDPPLSFLTLACGRMRGKRHAFWGRLHRVNDRLLVYTPMAFPPFSQNFSAIHRLNTRLLSSRIERFIRELSFKNPILGISWPLWGSVLRELKPRWSYYDCSDDYLTYPGLKANRETLRQSEEALLRSVDLVFCSAQKLKETKAVHNPNCFLIPNGLDSSFLVSREREEEVPVDLKPITRPILGYAGTLGEWLDFETLTQLAKAKPEWSIVMIGPMASARFSSVMQGISNLHWLGEKGYKELPGYLKRFDVCLIPFKVNEFTEKIYPTKFHEYLGVGKPVVSSELPDLKPFSPWVMFYHSPEEMVKVVERSLQDDSKEKALERRKIASENTWDQRVKTIEEIFDHYLR